MTDAEILASLDAVVWEPSCVVSIDESEVVRHAAPVDDAAREALREQAIERMLAEAAREREMVGA